ncbi:hypothetical protein KL86PLE_40752 [uncultured Pleomorphomonas sp.]|uniref:Uncharacterized protein n=1 Tax=uncultured Pleomorphomonas sp. TaxID=442121 RepID=A0A212LHI8_9HYPH|nr:hypothetical protein KL86PLE_40752 [uncultured Pleomorphomonas sp.]
MAEQATKEIDHDIMAFEPEPRTKDR